MSQPDIVFDRPPIVELVLGVQFAPLVQLTNGHMGRFWGQALEPEWNRASDALPVADQFEAFDAPSQWLVPNFQFLMRVPTPLSRLQISTESGDRMIQVQPTRFHYNWQKKDAEYPRYRNVRAAFDAYFARFQQFARDAKLGALVPNQWEITYVDHIPRGDLWQTPADWHNVLPGLLAPEPNIEGVPLENVGGEWHFEIAPRRGRVHVNVQSGRNTDTAEPVLMLQTTARGAVGPPLAPDLNAGLDLGHEAVRDTFLRITSTQAQRYWGRRET
jgi:uncharacterized protein (TIGR04255 family)